LNHHISQIFVLDFCSSSLMRDGPILAEHTTEVAVGEEDGAGAVVAHQRRLLPEVRMEAEDDRLDRSPAEPLLPFLPIHSAPSGTELTVLEEVIGLLDPLGQPAFFLQLRVSGLPPFLLGSGFGRGRREKKGTPCEKDGSFYEDAARDLHVRDFPSDTPSPSRREGRGAGNTSSFVFVKKICANFFC